MKLTEDLFLEMIREMLGKELPFIADCVSIDSYQKGYEDYYKKYLTVLKPKLQKFIENSDDEDEIRVVKIYLESNKDLEQKISRLINVEDNPGAKVAATIGSDNIIYRKVFIFWILEPLLYGKLSEALKHVY